MKREYYVSFGTKSGRGGWFIKEQMVIMARSKDEAMILAKHYCKPYEQVLDIEVCNMYQGA
jgi:hypothetical protein